MKIKVETAMDSLELINDTIRVVVSNEEYCFALSEVEEVLIITNDLGPIYDDMCMAIKINEETAIFIMSEHPSYSSFLFDQLGKAISINYEKIIEASTCIENNVFLIYKRE